MSKNVEGAKFVSQNVQYVLKKGPKGNLRPYTIGPVAKAAAVGLAAVPVWGWVVGIGVIAVAGTIAYACSSDDK